MMKGVSPVVATVLLIAIAVVAAVAVWFWVGAMGRPAVPAQEVKSFIVENCVLSTGPSANTTLRLYNNGALTVAAQADVKILTSNLGDSGFTVDVTQISPGARSSVSGSGNLTAGSVYYLEYPNIPLVKFGC